MSLAFMGGLYTGLGEGLEKFNKNELERAKLKKEQEDKVKKALTKHKTDEVDWASKTSKSFEEINDKITKLKQSDSKLTLGEREVEYNRLQKQKRDTVSRVGAEAAKLGYSIPEALATADYSNYKNIDGKWTNEDDYTQINEDPNLKMKDGKIFQRTQMRQVEEVNGKENVLQEEIWTDIGFEAKSVEDVFAIKTDEKTVRLGQEERSTRWFDKEYAGLKKKDPQAYEEKRSQFIDDLAVKAVAGKSEVKESKDAEQTEVAITQGITYLALDDSPSKTNKLKAVQRKILRNISPADEKSYTKKRDELQAESVTIKFLDDVNITMEKRVKNKTYQKGIVDNIVHNIESLTGITEEDKTYLGTIEVDTEVGFIKAMFVKAMSGATVSDKEREEYMQMFKGGDWSDETAAKATLKTMTTAMKKYHKKRAEQAKDILPFEYHNSLKYKTDSGKKSLSDIW